MSLFCTKFVIFEIQISSEILNFPTLFKVTQNQSCPAYEKTLNVDFTINNLKRDEYDFKIG